MDVGIRELRANLSRYLEQVKDGEAITVTDRGAPVARLVPMGERPLDRLIRDGVVVPAAQPKGPLPPPLAVEGSIVDLVGEQRR